MNSIPSLPPGQQLAATGKWPIVGERAPAAGDTWRGVEITGLVDSSRHWTFDELAQLPQAHLATDIHCVTRWSKLDVRFSGVWLDDLLRVVGVQAQARFISFLAHSERAHSTSLTLADALAQRTLLALACEGIPLDLSRGGPLRTIVRGKYFYKSLKWLRRIELLSEDRLGFWETHAGYHNQANPWREERFVATSPNRIELGRRLASLDFREANLLNLDLSGRDLSGMRAARGILRNADFRRARLQRADFSGANLSNAKLQDANLSDAIFRDADLEGADFCGADLRGADLRGASLFGATFCSTVPPDERTAAAVALIDVRTQYSAVALETLAPPQAAVLRHGTAT